MKYFTINGRNYKALEPDFNFMADYSDCMKNTMKAARAYLAFCGNMSETEAGYELNQHILNGGEVTDLLSAFNEELSNSAFFQKIMQNKETETAENQTEQAEETGGPQGGRPAGTGDKDITALCPLHRCPNQ